MEIVYVIIFGDGSIKATLQSGLTLPSLTTIKDVKTLINRRTSKVPIDGYVIKGYVFNFAVIVENEVFVLPKAIPANQIVTLMKSIKSKVEKVTTETILNRI